MGEGDVTSAPQSSRYSITSLCPSFAADHSALHNSLCASWPSGTNATRSVDQQYRTRNKERLKGIQFGVAGQAVVAEELNELVVAPARGLQHRLMAHQCLSKSGTHRS